MFYELSPKMLAKIKKANNILINIHKHADYDSFSSALSLSMVLGQIGKRSKVVSCQPVSKYFHFIEGADGIETINYSSFDFRDYDLFIVPDTGSYDRVTGNKDIKLPLMDYIIIDHHQTNEFEEKLKILDTKASATAEVLYRLFLDWGVDMDQKLATCLLTGILGDTVFLRYGENSKRTMEVVSALVAQGADKDYISENFYERYEFNTIKLLGVFLQNMKQEKKFVWSAVPYETFSHYGKPEGVREMAADLFFRGIKGSEFGIAMVEYKKGEMSMSFRSKKDTDVSDLAKMFGGGGHKNAAGATIKGEFEKTVAEVLSAIKVRLGK